MSLRGFSALDFWADDVAAAAAWYTEFLGVEPDYSQPGPDCLPAYIEFRIGSSLDELGIIDRRWRPPGAATEPGGAVMHWHVDDLEAIVERLLSLAGRRSTSRSPRTETRASSPPPWSTRSATFWA